MGNIEKIHHKIIVDNLRSDIDEFLWTNSFPPDGNYNICERCGKTHSVSSIHHCEVNIKTEPYFDKQIQTLNEEQFLGPLGCMFYDIENKKESFVSFLCKDNQEDKSDMLNKRVIMTTWYPGCEFEIGDVLFFTSKLDAPRSVSNKQGYYIICPDNQLTIKKILACDVERATNNFRQLQWAEKRKLEDIPGDKLADYLHCQNIAKQLYCPDRC